jgi:hypothetical protein
MAIIIGEGEGECTAVVILILVYKDIQINAVLVLPADVHEYFQNHRYS